MELEFELYLKSCSFGAFGKLCSCGVLTWVQLCNYSLEVFVELQVVSTLVMIMWEQVGHYSLGGISVI